VLARASLALSVLLAVAMANLACSPPEAIPCCFGEDSFRRHRAAALSAGLQARVLTLSRFGRDIDQPEDLLAFIDQPSATRSKAYLAESGIAHRLTEERARKGSRGRVQARAAAMTGSAPATRFCQ